MKERPILFSAPMVRAILSGTKTQTRRIVNPQPGGLGFQPIKPYQTPNGDWNFVLAATGHGTGDTFPCPYGKHGDRLWVREAFSICYNGPDAYQVIYSADRARQDFPCTHAGAEWLEHAIEVHGEGGRPSIHMPRWASRIDLEVTGVRVERLQDISEQDVIAEGIDKWWPDGRHGQKWFCPPHVRRFGVGENVEDVGFDGRPVVDPREAYRGLWESINGAGSWDANPWVWVLEFRRIK